MSETLYERLKQDVRFEEGLNACINCGICTANCPAARFYDYDPRMIVVTVQTLKEEEIEGLLKGDTIWYCGECLSCKTRCPRENTPGYIVQALRSLSIDTGYYKYSKKGRQQIKVKRTVGDNILKHGYCMYLDEITLEEHPEQGPVWDWYRNNAHSVLKRLGANYKGNGAGTMRDISQNDLDELRQIFVETGAEERFEKMEEYDHERK
ncbi:MAG: 4Fe-4S dicluster domain-containing protein [Bacteroidales bacterium]|nr:4Fe-4S dicluster domain-containing protein [Bacteroidales bacterium]